METELEEKLNELLKESDSPDDFIEACEENGIDFFDCIDINEIIDFCRKYSLASETMIELLRGYVDCHDEELYFEAGQALIDRGLTKEGTVFLDDCLLLQDDEDGDNMVYLIRVYDDKIGIDITAMRLYSFDLIERGYLDCALHIWKGLVELYKQPRDLYEGDANEFIELACELLAENSTKIGANFSVEDRTIWAKDFFSVTAKCYKSITPKGYHCHQDAAVSLHYLECNQLESEADVKKFWKLIDKDKHIVGKRPIGEVRVLHSSQHEGKLITRPLNPKKEKSPKRGGQNRHKRVPKPLKPLYRLLKKIFK